jgi:hypothetical protein
MSEGGHARAVLRLPGDAVIHVRPGILFQPLQREAVLLDVAGDSYYTLNGVGAFIWQQIVASATVAEIVQALSTAYGIDEATAATDLVEMVAALQQMDIVSLTQSSS